MLQSYADGVDLHLLTTLAILNMSKEEYAALPQPDRVRWRVVAKTVNFGIAYGIGADGIVKNCRKAGHVLHRNAAKAKAKARGYIDAFYALYEGVKEYIDNIHEFIETYGYISSVFGRTRDLSHVWSRDNDEAAKALRQGVNFTIQSTASDLTVSSLITVNQMIQDKYPRAKLIANIHDALDFDVPIAVSYTHLRAHET